MDTTILSEKMVNEILSRALYWKELTERHDDFSGILNHETREILGEIGFNILWILEAYAKSCK